MKNTKLVLALALTSGLTLMGACGGSDEEAKSDGASGTTATSKGGSSGSGGTTSGGTDSGGSNSAGTNTGGTTTAGTNSAGGEPSTPGAGGGDSTNPAECPATAPTDGEACAVDVTLMDGGCEYAGTVCGCQQPFGGGPGGPGGGGDGAAAETEWACFEIDGGGGGAPGDPGGFGGAGATNPDCPADQPTNGADCEGPIFGCDYGGTGCTCPPFGDDADTWVCE